ncbi:hypothetical protein, conserved [Trypanosoma brucei brucei TREU927]|uniref:Uncharacterized protein n=1 Tax=Trypanosoma brucei brucei (strain 927/4 GUTat10.1) TaxID=185431 RepID=Q586Z2_TRYB2|nr:hypothetical protein, conserved [Trypanosoma brucei brucei TREU927]AAX79285.1 hypothetical protein, conserved [Trypanosoma brucei]AAZ11984.1 hypothetical protein, conserved [Trypanosoma brucei brucei TREU927]
MWFAEVLVVVCVFTTTAVVSEANNCTSGSACQPWDGGKPCNGAQRMDLRVGVRDSASGNISALGFCPIVDEVQAFRLTGLFPSLVNKTVGSSYTISVYGQGESGNRTGDLSNSVLYATTSDKCKSDSLAVAKFLILNLSMKQGLYTYAGNASYPTDTGFFPTCERNQCLLSSDAFCIGNGVNNNCASCVEKGSLGKAETTVWASYYGSAAGGVLFRSGDYNPKNFHAFSIGVPQKV